MHNDYLHETLSLTTALLIYAAFANKIRVGVERVTARGDIYDKGYAAGYDRGYEDGRRHQLIPIPREG